MGCARRAGRAFGGGWGAAVAVAILVACTGNSEGDRTTPPPAESESAGTDTLPLPRAGTTYRRTIAFVDVASDTAMFVPWEFENRVNEGEIGQSIRAWLGRSGQWEMFVREDWSTPLVETPWRIVPHGSARLVMGFNNVLRELYFVEGLRDVSIRPVQTIAEWVGSRGDRYTLLSGSAVLAGREIPGLVLDASTTFHGDSSAVSETILLVGDDLRLLVADGHREGSSRAWALADDTSIALSRVEVSWPRTVPLERARREVPVVWQIESRIPPLTGEVEAISSHQYLGEGDGALLPVVGIYEVRGEVTLGATTVQVSGLVRHSQR